ncbi:MAG: polysaccharide pyruvyl transferase family protein [Deltaproteobacteria bacterium]|nr:polysaccharide pyruvyl transferase family protein [Deltaproteobacteria bacterium]
MINVTLFGSNSGNNLGDAAILGSILLNFKAYPFYFFVPTPKPDFVNLYKKINNVSAVDIHPLRSLSVRFLGATTLNALRKSQYVFICDGILFGKRLFDPSFNFLSNIFCLLPVLKALKLKLVIFAAGLGPFNSYLSTKMVKSVLNASELIMLRDDESISLVQNLKPDLKTIRVGDPAFINPVSPESVCQAILEKHEIENPENLIGVNLTNYLGSWVSCRFSKKDFVIKVSEHLRIAKEKSKLELLFISTHPMDNSINESVAELLGSKFLPAGNYLSHDIMALMKKLKLFVGMRFHSLVLASAVGIPVIGIKYAPKVESLLKLFNTPELCVHLDKIDCLAETIQMTMKNIDGIRQIQQIQVQKEKLLAQKAFDTFVEFTNSSPLAPKVENI